MIGGYMGKILRVNLTTKAISQEKLKEDLARNFVGGVGTAARILYDEVPPWAAPLDPANRLVFSTGPVTGTIAPTAGRHTVVAKSPLTGFNNTTADVIKAGERIYNLKRAFNMRHGCSREEDTLPERLLKEKTKAGTVVKLDKTLPQYFKVRGWDPKTSKPTKKKLLELGLRDVAGDLWP